MGVGFPVYAVEAVAEAISPTTLHLAIEVFQSIGGYLVDATLQSILPCVTLVGFMKTSKSYVHSFIHSFTQSLINLT